MKIKVMRSFTIKLSCILLLFILAASASAPAKGRQQGVSADALQTDLSAGQKLKQAESAADRLIERFHETLDFRVVFDENFVTEPELRKRALRFENEQRTGWRHEEPLIERHYVAEMTCLHLLFEYLLSHDDTRLPADFERARATSKYFKARTPNNPQPLTDAEMKEAIAEAEQVAAILRKQFAPGIFQSQLYLKKIAEERTRAERNGHNVPRVEKGNEKLEISPQTPVYIVRPEVFDYYFIEENGDFKLFYVDFFPNFKLF